MREQFLLDPGVTFLNHGSFGACPMPVLESLQHWQREMERNPVEFLGRRSAGLLAQARATLADLLGADPDALALVTNATTGVNIVARSLALAPGDEILATDHEYGACEAAWRFVCERTGAHYRRVAIPLPFEPRRFVERMMAAVTPRTRVVFASHITSTTALVFPVAALCAAARERGIATLIDGAHAPGQIALDLAAVGADYYTGNGHKWLCGPKGTAFLHVRPEHQARLHAHVVSWGYVADDAGHTGFDAYVGRTPLERRLNWLGTRDIAPFLALPAALDFQARHGWPQHRERCRAMALALMHRVAARTGLPPIGPDEAFAQMAPLPVHAADAEALRRRLFDEHRIEVPVTQHAGRVMVRASVQAYNSEEELARLESALQALGVLAPALG